MKKTFRILLSTGIFFLGLISTGANAVSVTLSDYFIGSNPGDSWTYTYTSGLQTGTDFTVFDQPSASSFPLLPDVAETDQLIPLEPNINIVLQLIDSFSVQAGTFNNVLVMVSLDENFPANFVNSDFGIDPIINQGVTDVIWFGQGVGVLSFMDVEAAVPVQIGETYELKSYSVSAVPIPAAVWLFGTGLVGFIGFIRRKA